MISNKYLDTKIYEYVKENPNKNNLYEAKDNARHYGLAFQHTWKEFMYSLFLNYTDNQKLISFEVN